MKHSTDFLGEKSFRAYEDGFRACAAPAHRRGRRPRRLRPRAAGRRPRGRAQGARLRPHRPPERERRDAHGADLRLALPEAHPPLGDDRRQPARATSSGTRRRPTSSSAATPRSARRTRAAARGPTTSPPSMRRTAANMPDRWLFLPIEASNVRIATFYGLMETTSEMAPLNGADDARRVALRGRGRRERVLAPVALREARFRCCSSGASTRRPRARRPGGADYFAAGEQKGGTSLGYAGRRSPGAAAAWPTPGRPRRTRTRTAGCGRRRWRRS